MDWPYLAFMAVMINSRLGYSNSIDHHSINLQQSTNIKRPAILKSFLPARCWHILQNRIWAVVVVKMRWVLTKTTTTIHRTKVQTAVAAVLMSSAFSSSSSSAAPGSASHATPSPEATPSSWSTQATVRARYVEEGPMKANQTCSSLISLVV